MKNDNWYDPKQFRRPPDWKDLPEVTPPRGEVGRYLFWIVIFGLVYLGADYLTKQRARSPASHSPVVLHKPLSVSECGGTALPTNGAVRIFEPSIMKRSDAIFAGLRFENQLGAPLTATLLVDATPVAAVLAHAGQVAELSTPVSAYRLELRTGSVWCQQTKNFIDPRQINVNGGIESVAGKTTIVRIEADAETPSGMRLEKREETASSSPPGATVVAPGVLQVAADPRGHYVVPGTINGQAVSFFVDTGATNVSMSRKTANRIGLYDCTKFGTSSTANGRVEHCVVSNAEVAFGPFRFPGKDVLVVPDMDDEVLLGMSVLKQLTLVQAGGVLRMSSP